MHPDRSPAVRGLFLVLRVSARARRRAVPSGGFPAAIAVANARGRVWREESGLRDRADENLSDFANSKPIATILESTTSAASCGGGARFAAGGASVKPRSPR